MTQDPYGQPPGTGHVARGEVVPGDEANVIPPAVPVTQFQKVASALRGDRTDPTIPAHVASDAAAATSQDAQGAARDDATGPEEVVAVRSPDAGSRNYWEDAEEPRETAPEEAAPREPVAAGADAATRDPAMTQPDLDGAARSETDTARSEMDTARSETDTATAGAGEPEVVGKHAGTQAQEGLRAGQSGDGLGDFSDLTYGSLLPDAAEFKARWQQVQFRFVDDPPGSVTEAADVVAQVTAKLEAAIAERQRVIAERQRALRSRWSEGKSTDTESLRETLLMYRAFLDQLTGPKDG